MNLNTLLILFLSLFIASLVFIPLVLGVIFYFRDKTQRQHSVLRNFPVLGRVRYFLEQTGPEFRQYLFDGDADGKPFSRNDFLSVIFPAKYLSTVISFGSKRDFEKPGYYIRNAMFPTLAHKMRVDNNSEVSTKKYITKEETLTKRVEKFKEEAASPYLLDDKDAIVIGAATCREPFRLKGQVGMSGMSYGALGENAISALSSGLAIAGGAWMNTGEGGLSDYHLTGGGDIIMQIGPGKFGVRTIEGEFDWEELKRKSEIPQVKAFELKMGQGAKIKGGLLPSIKNTPNIAKARGVLPHTTVNSPTRFEEFDSLPTLLDFVEKIREVSGKPVGIKIVVGSVEDIADLAEYMKDTGRHPDFISIDGGEGGSGATYQEMADSMGLPIKSALMLVNTTLEYYGVRDKVKLIASGKLFTADRIAVALGMGADLVQIARAYMITIGCIGAQHCHKNTCPVGVATTDPKLQKALVVEDKKYRVANYTMTMRQGLFSLAAASGLATPADFTSKQIVFNNEANQTNSLRTFEKEIIQQLKELERQPVLN